MDGDRSTEILNMIMASTNKVNSIEEKLDIVVSKQDYLQRAFDEFRSETRTNFDRTRTDIRQTQAMLSELGGDIVKIRGMIKGHEQLLADSQFSDNSFKQMRKQLRQIT